MDKLDLNSYPILRDYCIKYNLNAEIRGRHKKIAELYVDGELKPFPALENLLKSLGREQDLLYIVTDIPVEKENKLSKFKKRSK